MVTFLMDRHDVDPKHSTRFNFSGLDVNATSPTDFPVSAVKTWKPSFYIPKPVAEKAKRIRVTIEVIE